MCRYLGWIRGFEVCGMSAKHQAVFSSCGAENCHYRGAVKLCNLTAVSSAPRSITLFAALRLLGRRSSGAELTSHSIRLILPRLNLPTSADLGQRCQKGSIKREILSHFLSPEPMRVSEIKFSLSGNTDLGRHPPEIVQCARCKKSAVHRRSPAPPPQLP